MTGNKDASGPPAPKRGSGLAALRFGLNELAAGARSGLLVLLKLFNAVIPRVLLDGVESRTRVGVLPKRLRQDVPPSDAHLGLHAPGADCVG